MIRTLFLLFSLSGAAIADFDKDSEIYYLDSVTSLPGTLQPDVRTFELGARYWEISTKTIELEGETPKEIETSWKKFVKKQRAEFLELVKNEAIDSIEEDGIDASWLSNKLIKYINEETDVVLEYSFGKGSSKKGQKISKWFKDEILTRAARQKLNDELDGENFELFDVVDWTYFHIDNTAAELTGGDVIIIRGEKRILKIEIFYNAV